MYKVELASSNVSISDFSDEQLICSYIFVKKTFYHLYKKKLRLLNKREKKAIIYDISQFQNLKQKSYTLRCLTPEKWLENWPIYNGIESELKKRELSYANLGCN
jgi:hypothetical protein